MKLSTMTELTFAVQCRRDPATATFGLGWETIAAFNSEYVAERYKRECQSGKIGRYEYRIIEIEA